MAGLIVNLPKMHSCRAASCAYSLDEIGRLYAECLRQRSNRQQAYIYLRTLQRSDGIAVQIRKLREPFLGYPALLSNLAQSLSECNQDLTLGICHGGTVRMSMPEGLQGISCQGI